MRIKTKKWLSILWKWILPTNSFNNEGVVFHELQDFFGKLKIIIITPIIYGQLL